MEDGLKSLGDRIMARVAVVLLIALAPVITLVVAIACVLDSHRDSEYAAAFALFGPVVCAFWYMFVASVTRAARAKREGISPRKGFFWAGGRLFGGWFLSQSCVLLVLALNDFVGRGSIENSPRYILFPSLYLGLWAPVIFNLLGHFSRHSKPIPGVKLWEEMGDRFAQFASDGDQWVILLPTDSKYKDAKAALVFDMLAITHQP
jgi:hypothetical protein